jgi:hypothetical protein
MRVRIAARTARRKLITGILCTHGPMGRSIEDLEMYMKLVAAAKPWRKDPV